jgi:cytochrome b subunit of formate dehydrogenase
MTYAFNASDKVANDVPNPFKIENIFLLLLALALTSSAISILFTARTYFEIQEDKFGAVAVTLATAQFGAAVTFLAWALSQLRFYLGRKYPIGLAEEMPLNTHGLAAGALSVINTLQQQTIEIPEPQGALNGILYSLIPSLITSPQPIQAAAVQHFHALIGMAGVFCSMTVSYYHFAGGTDEGMISWFYLPMTGLSLFAPFMSTRTMEFSLDVASNANRMLWKLIGLLSFAILAPALAPRHLPALHVPPMWTAPFLLLIAAMVATGIFLLSLFAHLEEKPQTSVSIEQTTISMNCHPAQLWPKIRRDMQSNWVRGIPNRVYANVAPGMATADSSRGAFQGYLLQETQPTVSGSRESVDTLARSTDSGRRYLITLNVWGTALGIIASMVGAYFAPRFIDMQCMEISRVALVMFALCAGTVIAFRSGHLLWSRMHYKSRLILISIEGTFQSGDMFIGNQFSGNAQSRATITRVQDATLKIWVSDVVTLSLGKDNERFVVAMTPADDYAKATLDELKKFAANQSSVAAPTTIADIEIAKSIGYLNAALATSFHAAPSTSFTARGGTDR